MQDSQTAPTPNEEPKRTRRQRTPVTLLQHEYDVIYSYSNNHKTRKIKPDENGENSNRKVDDEGTSESMEMDMPKSSKSATSSANSSIASGPSSSKNIPSATSYQWIGEGTQNDENDDGNNYDGDDGVLYYQKVEIVVGGHPAVIKVGDDVLVSSDDYSETDLLDKGPTAVILKNLGEDNSDDEDSSVKDSQAQDDSIDKVKPQHVAMNSLKPFVGRVLSMWEEGITDSTKAKENDIVQATDDRKDRMKVKIQWYYKREDVKRTKGTFIGIPRQKAMSLLSPRDLLLAEYVDKNDIPSILGKCRIVRCRPPESNDTGKNKDSFLGKNGSFRCCYNIAVEGMGSKQRIHITPYDGVEEDEADDSSLDDSQRPKKRARSNSYDGSDVEMDGESQGTESVDATETEAEAMSAGEDDDDDSSFLQKKPPPTSEGAATQKIMVGEKHQAVVPPLETGAYVSSRKEINLPPIMTWRPNAMSPSALSSFVKDAGQILRTFMEDHGFEISRSVPETLHPKHLPSNFTCREFDMDAIFQCLHMSGYDTFLTLKMLKNHPQKYLFLWTKEEKALYNAGFRRNFNEIHDIAKGMMDHTNNKNHRNVVDYHYRFKIPDQFQRYEDRKREQAKRMLECVERHRLDEFLSPRSSAAATQYATMNNENGTSNRLTGAALDASIGASKKSQNWARTGGGPSNSVGALERRRLVARDFLVTVKNTVGVEQYLILVNHLKGLHARVLTIPQCREAFALVLKEKHPELMKCFDDYLPQRFRES